MLGNGRLEAQCFDGEKRLAHIRGKMRKKASQCTVLIHDSYHKTPPLRFGLIKEILSFSLSEISKMIRRM